MYYAVPFVNRFGLEGCDEFLQRGRIEPERIIVNGVNIFLVRPYLVVRWLALSYGCVTS